MNIKHKLTIYDGNITFAQINDALPLTKNEGNIFLERYKWL